MSSVSSPPQVRVGVGCFITDAGRVLVLRRHGAHGSGTWSLPGGHQEFGESPEDTAVREVTEETGLVVTTEQRLGFTNDNMPEEGKHYVTVFIQCRVVSGTARILEPHKATDLRWVTLRELREWDDVFLPLKNFLTEHPEFTA